ncbi:hypothetical protein SYNGFB01_09375, partial [Synechococcus sp. GFB01]
MAAVKGGRTNANHPGIQFAIRELHHDLLVAVHCRDRTQQLSLPVTNQAEAALEQMARREGPKQAPGLTELLPMVFQNQAGVTTLQQLAALLDLPPFALQAQQHQLAQVSAQLRQVRLGKASIRKAAPPRLPWVWRLCNPPPGLPRWCRPR